MCTPQVMATDGMRLHPLQLQQWRTIRLIKKHCGEQRQLLWYRSGKHWIGEYGCGSRALLLGWLWIHCTAAVVLLDLERLPPLSEWNPESSEASSSTTPNILLLGPPKSETPDGRKTGHPLVLVFKWLRPGSGISPVIAAVVALNHYEFGIDSAVYQQPELVLLEKLIHIDASESSFSPMSIRMLPQRRVSGHGGGGEKDIPAAIQILDRWALLLYFPQGED